MVTQSETANLETAVSIAQAAGRLLVQLRNDAGSMDPKLLRDKADAAAQELIVSQLEIEDGYALLSEEGVDNTDRLAAQRVWIVDPLDGTWEYGQGRADFGVHIALWDMAEQRMVLGVVDLPEQGLTRTSADPNPTLAPLPTERPIRIVASRNRPPAELDAIVTRLGEKLDYPVEVVNVGSVGAKVNEILMGRAEAYLHDTGFYEWDLAAPQAVAHHYGLVLSHWDQTQVVYNLMPPFVKNVFVAHPDLAADLQAVL